MHAPSGAAGGSGNGQAAIISEETKQMCIDDSETKSVVMENTHAHMYAYTYARTHTHTRACVILVGTWPLLPPLDVAHCSGANYLITRHTSCDSKADFCLFICRQRPHLYRGRCKLSWPAIGAAQARLYSNKNRVLYKNVSGEMFSFKMQTLKSRSNGAVEENTARSSSFLSENDKTSLLLFLSHQALRSSVSHVRKLG